MSAREDEVLQAFISIAGGLVTGTDLIDVLNVLTADCARLLDVAAAGMLLADRRGSLHVVAASSERTEDLEAFQVQRGQGPCRDCYNDGLPVLVPDLAAEVGRWPQFVPHALGLGFVSVHAVPLRLRGNVLGALGLFGSAAGCLNDEDLRLGQALADVATIALVQDRTAADAAAVNAQLQHALDSRVVLEQAKGVLSYSGELDMHDAFSLLRRYARSHNLKIADVALALVNRSLAAQEVLSPGRLPQHD
ncbi:MAG TPA: GAF and ANTAR domain-containing protein [Mycobacteriales bacterium]|nr:GAF and ANTAR domain-containing protein [Mycobacteriales bacterium]